jgi:hypothetical protein
MTAFFISATFLAAVILTARNVLDLIEIYIILLLNFGSAFFAILIFLWRLATGFNPRWDPTRFLRAKQPARLFNLLYALLLLAVSIYQIWFWAAMKNFMDIADHCP